MTSYYIPAGLAVPFLIWAQINPTDTGIGVAPTLVGQAVILLTTVILALFQVYRENRARRWAKEDAAELAIKVKEEAAELARKTKEEADLTREKTESIVRHVGANVSNFVGLKALEADARREVLEAKLDLNTEITKAVANGGAKHLYENAEPSPVKVEVVNSEDQPVPVKEPHRDDK